MADRRVGVLLSCALLGASACECESREAETPPSLDAELSAIDATLADRERAIPDDLDHSIGLVDGALLTPLRASLDATRAGASSTRLLFFGGSHTASDLYTTVVRDTFQRSFGDGGHGFVHLGPPIENYWQSGVRIEATEGFSNLEPSPKRMGVDDYGLGGMIFEATGPAHARIATEGHPADRVELHYLEGPAHGTIEVAIDGAVHRIETSGPETIARTQLFAVDDREHTIDVRALGDGVVSIHGLVLERSRPGVVVDQLGLAGAKARHLLMRREASLGPLVAARHPDLMAFSYGNNETDDRHLPDLEHAAHFDRMLTTMRRLAPDAACLVIGPTDRTMTEARGDRILDLLEGEQRRIAHERGCAFFDTLRWQRGRGAMRRLFALVPPLAREDGMHLTEAGYRALGMRLTRALVAALRTTPDEPALDAPDHPAE